MTRELWVTFAALPQTILVFDTNTMTRAWVITELFITRRTPPTGFAFTFGTTVVICHTIAMF